MSATTYTLTPPASPLLVGVAANFTAAPNGTPPGGEQIVLSVPGVVTSPVGMTAGANLLPVIFPAAGLIPVYATASPTGMNDPYNASNPLTVTVYNPLTTIGYIKDFGGINVYTYDSYLTNRLVEASAAIESWCNRTFGVSTYTEVHDGPGSTTLLLHQGPVQSVTQVITGYNCNMPQTVPGSQFWVKSKEQTIGFLPSSTFNGFFPYGDQTIQVTYTAGNYSIPLEVQQACAMIVMKQFSLRGADTSMASEKIGDYAYTRGSLLPVPVEAQALLFKYKQWVT